jgi:hypothetical protein
MKPIAQTFIINEPENGVSAVFLTALDLYFQSKSSVYGVEVQIRTTQNGVPTSLQLPYASKNLESSNVNISQDASLATTFTFDTPVVLETNEQYAIVVIPNAGNPDYKIWTAALGQIDVSTNALIDKNNQTGSLFVSSNDLNFTPIQLESMKFKLYRANFTATSGVAAYRNSNTDFFRIKDIIGEFVVNEKVVVANSSLSLGYLNITANTGAFTVGETIFQSSTGTTPNTATGLVYSVNSSVIKVQGISGAFINSGNTTVKGASSLATATIVTANQYVQTYGNSTISVPYIDHPDFANGNYIYVGTNARANVQFLQIIGNNSVTNTLALSANINFANDTASFIGRVRGDNTCYGYIDSISGSGPYTIFVGGLNVNAASNFANTKNKYMIGINSGASANIEGIYNLYYDSITSQFAFATPEQTSSQWSFSGTSNTKSLDSSNTLLQAGIPYEFIDKERMIMSRSNELANPGSIGTGNSSLKIYNSMTSANNKISPYSDRIRRMATLTYNLVLPASQLNGYRIEFTNSVGSFVLGDTIWQSNSTVNTSAVVYSVNSSVLLVSSVTSSNVSSVATFNANGSSIITSSNTGGVANVTSTTLYDETLGNYYAGTKYVSKNVILATGQDAEDLVAYLTAYRPDGTDFQVYGKFSHAQDAIPFNDNEWSRLVEDSDPALRSSLVNRDDLVELRYVLPTTVQIYGTGSGASIGNTSSNATFTGANTTDPFRAGDFVYFADKSFFAVNTYIANAGTGYANGDQIMLTGTSGYQNANATFTVGTNPTGNVINLTLLSPGNYSTNTAIASNATSNVTGSGAGLTITVNNFNQSTFFDVQKVIAVTNSTSLTLNSNIAFTSGNVAIGTIPGMQSEHGAFRYANNSGIVRYISSDGTVYDTYKTFSMKIVLTSNASQIVPRMSDMRCLALQV